MNGFGLSLPLARIKLSYCCGSDFLVLDGRVLRLRRHVAAFPGHSRMLTVPACFAGIRSWVPWRRRANGSCRGEMSSSDVKILTAGNEELATSVGALGDLSSAESASVSRSLLEDVKTEWVEGYGLDKSGPPEIDGATAQSGKNEGKIINISPKNRKFH